MQPIYHLDKLIERVKPLAVCRDSILSAFELCRDSYKNNKKLLLCGNGGSAADAEHCSGELLKGFCSLRPLDSGQREGLPDIIADNLQNGLAAIPLTSFISLATAYANDSLPQLVFSQLVWALGQKGDILLCFSTSGNSENVLYAAQTARAKGMKVVSFSGKGGGKLKALSDINIIAPDSETHRIQELHLPAYHVLCLMLEEEFFGTELLIKD